MAETAGHIPYPVGTDFVRDGDNAMRAIADALDPPLVAGSVGKGFRPLIVGGATIMTNGAPIVGPARIRTIRSTTTTDVNGRFWVDAAYGLFNHVSYASVTSINGGVIFDMDPASSNLTAGVCFYCRNPANGTVLGNRFIEFNGLVIGA